MVKKNTRLEDARRRYRITVICAIISVTCAIIATYIAIKGILAT